MNFPPFWAYLGKGILGAPGLGNSFSRRLATCHGGVAAPSRAVCTAIAAQDEGWKGWKGWGLRWEMWFLGAPVDTSSKMLKSSPYDSIWLCIGWVSSNFLCHLHIALTVGHACDTAICLEMRTQYPKIIPRRSQLMNLSMNRSNCGVPPI